MKRIPLNKKLLISRLLISAAGLATPGIAFAYLDPGTVSLLIQGLIGAIAAAGAAVSLWWNNIKGFFGRLKNRRNTGANARDKSDDDHTSTK